MPRQHRDNLTGEHHIGDIGQATLYCLFMALWMSDMVFGKWKWSNGVLKGRKKRKLGFYLRFLNSITS